MDMLCPLPERMPWEWTLLVAPTVTLEQKGSRLSQSRPNLAIVFVVLSFSFGRVHANTMARFRAYTTDSSDDEDEEKPTSPAPQPRPATKPNARPTVDTNMESDSEEDESEEAERSGAVETEEDEDEDEDEGAKSDGSEESTSSMREAEILLTKKPTRNALVPGEDGEFAFAHEINGNGHIPPGVDARKVEVMRASFFETERERAAMRAAEEQTGRGVPRLSPSR